MHMSFEELLNIKGMEHARLIAGSGGTWRRISGAHVVELTDAQKWVKEGDLLFVSGVGLKRVDVELQQIVKAVGEKNVAGVVIELGPFIKKVSQSVIDQANEINIPLLELPFSVPIGDIISKVYFVLFNPNNAEKSMKELMESIIYDENEIAYEKAFYYGFHESIKHVAFYVGVDEAAEIMDERLKRTFLYAVKEQFSHQIPFFYLVEENQVIVIADYGNQSDLKDFVVKCIEGMNMRLYPCNKTVSLGVGKTFLDVRSIRSSAMEAKKAYKILRVCHVKSGARYYEEIGVYQLFFDHNPEELQEFSHENLGPLYAYDEQNDSELVETLRIYLESDCNITNVTEKMYVHRNTVKYRIKRIEEILGGDLSNVNRQFNLRLAYKIIKYLS